MKSTWASTIRPGARSNETSGRAILQRQRESDTATFTYIDNLSRAIRHAGRVMVDLIPKVYNAPRIIRVIHGDGSNEKDRPHQSAIHARPGQSPQAQAYEAGKTQETVDGLTRIYDVTTGKYDVTCEAGPDFSTKREEAAAQMMELGRMFPPMMQVAGDLLVKNLIGLERTILPTDSKPCCRRSCKANRHRSCRCASRCSKWIRWQSRLWAN